jgi:hypothetical protein
VRYVELYWLAAMPSENPVITISIPPGLRVPGEQVAGLLDFNVGLAEEKGVEEVKLSLKGVLTTYASTNFYRWTDSNSSLII